MAVRCALILAVLGMVVALAVSAPVGSYEVSDIQPLNPVLPKLAICIVSHPKNFEQRQTDRDTWLQYVKTSPLTPALNQLTIAQKESVVYRFVIGTVLNETLESQLQEEQRIHKDILRVPVHESYANISVKMLEFFEWAGSEIQPTWVFKADDDSFVRLDRLVNDLHTNRTQTGLYMGKVWSGSPVESSIDHFSPYERYPPFCAGAGYVFSSDILHFIIRNTPVLHRFPIEDVGIGMVVNTLDMKATNNPYFHSQPEGCDDNMIVQNPATPDQMRIAFHASVLGTPCLGIDFWNINHYVDTRQLTHESGNNL